MPAPSVAPPTAAVEPPVRTDSPPDEYAGVPPQELLSSAGVEPDSSVAAARTVFELDERLYRVKPYAEPVSDLPRISPQFIVRGELEGNLASVSQSANSASFF